MTWMTCPSCKSKISVSWVSVGVGLLVVSLAKFHLPWEYIGLAFAGYAAFVYWCVPLVIKERDPSLADRCEDPGK
jgi:hypothetical protein